MQKKASEMNMWYIIILLIVMNSDVFSALATPRAIPEQKMKAIAMGACLGMVASMAYIAGRMTGPLKLDFLRSKKAENNIITVTLSIEPKEDSPLIKLMHDEGPNPRLAAQVMSMFSQAKSFEIKIGDRLLYQRNNEQKAQQDTKLARWKES